MLLYIVHDVLNVIFQVPRCNFLFFIIVITKMILDKYTNFTVDNYMVIYDAIYPKETSSASSRASFLSALRRIETVYNSPIQTLKLTWINNKDDLISKMIEQNYSMNSILLTLNMIMKLLKLVDAPLSIIDSFGKTIAGINKRNQEIAINQQFTPREQEQYVPWDEIMAKIISESDFYLNTPIGLSSTAILDYNEYRNFLILASYVLMPAPVRIGNFLNCQIILGFAGEPSTLLNNNYLIKNTNNEYIFVFNKYKTAHRLGQQITKIDSQLLTRLLNKYFNSEHLNNKPMVFLPKTPNSKTELIQSDVSLALGTITKKHFGKSFSIDMLRHSFITWLLSQDPNLKLKMEVASEMGQGFKLNMQDQYRRI